MCKDQKDWSNHLQSIAYFYRASATTNLILSPFECLFGRRMELRIDHAMGIPEQSIGNTEQYAVDVGQRLQVSQQIAKQNATESGDRYRTGKNKDAKLPTFKLGDKVLLYDSTTKTGENRKLKIRYKGPFYIIQVRPGYSYRLQNCESGLDVNRPVHASRLRHLYERSDELQCSADHAVVYQGSTGRYNVRVVVRDITTASEEGLLCYVDNRLQPIGEDSVRIHKCGGSRIREQLTEATRGASEPTGVVVTTAANMPASSLINMVVEDDTNDELKGKLLYSLGIADKHVTSLALPFPGLVQLETQLWTSAQLMIETLKEFFTCNDNNNNINRVCFVCSSLLSADIMSVVCRTLLIEPSDNHRSIIPDNTEPIQPVQPVQPVINDEPNNDVTNTEPPIAENDWHAITRILRQRLHRGKRQYLVQWSDSEQTSWLPRCDVSDFAVTQFLQSRRPRRRRRQ